MKLEEADTATPPSDAPRRRAGRKADVTREDWLAARTETGLDIEFSAPAESRIAAVSSRGSCNRGGRRSVVPHVKDDLNRDEQSG